MPRGEECGYAYSAKISSSFRRCKDEGGEDFCRGLPSGPSGFPKICTRKVKAKVGEPCTTGLICDEMAEPSLRCQIPFTGNEGTCVHL